jgi:CRISPR-associated protein Cas5d
MVRLHVWGERACFLRDQPGLARVSHDVPPAAAMRAVLEAIHAPPGLRWQVERLHVLRRIRFQSFPRGLRDFPAAQEAVTILLDVAYLVEAQLTPGGAAAAREAEAFRFRAAAGMAQGHPALGAHAFPARFAPAAADPVPPSALTSDEQARLFAHGPGALPTRPVSLLPDDQRSRDLGLLPIDAPGAPGHFHAVLADGVLDYARPRG